MVFTYPDTTSLAEWSPSDLLKDLAGLELWYPIRETEIHMLPASTGRFRGRLLAFKDRKLREEFLTRQRQWLIPVVELVLIFAWALWIGREYLDFNPRQIPAGREFLSAIQTHHIWTTFQECGWCALWNGSVRGGNPAFVDIHGSMLHPLVIVATFIWGVINGSKIVLVVSLWAAGLAQWWLARELRLGWIARMWSALLAVAGGHLAGRMQLGALGVVLSTAMCSLVLPAVLMVQRKHDKKAVVLLAITTASAVLSGQGYMQVGLLATLPAFAFLLMGEPSKRPSIWNSYMQAGVIALLLAAPFLVPLGHFLPNLVKEMDAAFGTAQPLNFLPLNLVIDSHAFYLTDSLEKFPFPELYTLYIGWFAVILSAVGLSMTRREHRSQILFLVAVAFIEFLVGSAVLLKWLVGVFPPLAGIRNPSQIAGLAIPPILAIAGYGLDRLLALNWPDLSLKNRVGSDFELRALSLKWLLVIPLIFNLRSAHHFTRHWLYMNELDDNVYALLETLETPDLQWVATPFGEHFYIEPAIASQLKLSPGIRTWNWESTAFPVPMLEANRLGPPPDPVEEVTEVDGIPIYKRNQVTYAAVVSAAESAACQALGSGGWIDVTCDSSLAGTLVVQENSWTGWRAWLDDKPVQLLPGQWLQVQAPAGYHKYKFRYIPWDVPIGLTLLILGLCICGWYWWHPSYKHQTELTSRINADQAEGQRFA